MPTTNTKKTDKEEKGYQICSECEILYIRKYILDQFLHEHTFRSQKISYLEDSYKEALSENKKFMEEQNEKIAKKRIEQNE